MAVWQNDLLASGKAPTPGSERAREDPDKQMRPPSKGLLKIFNKFLLAQTDSSIMLVKANNRFESTRSAL
jgi:hypothetical protein